MLKKILNSKYFLAFIGLIFLISYIWARFIRERLPRDIPFLLTFFSFIIITYIFLFYSYALLRLIKPKVHSPIMLKTLSIISKIGIPWITLDNMVKGNKYIKPYFIQFLQQTIRWAKPSTIFTNLEKIYITYFILPKGMLLVVFLSDIFYFHQLKYFYAFMPLSLIPSLANYFLYSLRVHINNIFEYLNKSCLLFIISEDSDDKDYFIDIIGLKMNYGNEFGDIILDSKNIAELQATAIKFEHTLYEYDCWIIDDFKNQYYKDHGLTNLTIEQSVQIQQELKKKLLGQLTIAIEGTVILETMNYAPKFPIIIKLYMAIIFVHIICWGYILIVSIYTLDIINIFKIFKSIYENPFF